MHHLILGGYILREQDVLAFVDPNLPVENGHVDDPLDLFFTFVGWYDEQPKDKHIPVPNCFRDDKDEFKFYLPVSAGYYKDHSYRKTETDAARVLRDNFLAATGDHFSVANMEWCSVPAEEVISPLRRSR
ncbi:hypothetical protein FA95DRAFT_1595645 [Auriscalpium vulgare]|uniref:Uncharacterized protein n=1 Tax=Auriscalpium vulgare TaxID=40419 RepID=A0ACB8RU04_9AGAM|nr:hypothetical protein FA95DRAFT_1595645 [Auriscalpium vulgare]